MKKLDMPNLDNLAANVRLYAQLKHETGADGVAEKLAALERSLIEAIDAIRALPEDTKLAEQEPNDLAGIKRLRPAGPRSLWDELPHDEYLSRLEGALMGRFAGAILGSPVEGWSVEKMKEWAGECETPFPPTDYWRAVMEPQKLRYKTTRKDAYTVGKMEGVPVEDDLAFTVLGLLILEDAGISFTTSDVAKAWTRYLPFACTAEDVALTNLLRGVPPEVAGHSDGETPIAMSCYMSLQLGRRPGRAIDNPYYQWIGADIRSDPWGYVAPGKPERAAEFAYRDAYLSHRRNGLFGAMFFSAAIAAAFAVDDPMEALKVGLTEIPENSWLSREIRWALDEAPGIRNYQDARDAVAERFPGMHHVHTINNACLTIWGVNIGGTDLTRVLSETVAMGYDNDCTAATAGSIVGAVIGAGNIPEHWTRPFKNRIQTFLHENTELAIDDLVRRFARQATLVFGG